MLKIDFSANTYATKSDTVGFWSLSSPLVKFKDTSSIDFYMSAVFQESGWAHNSGLVITNQATRTSNPLLLETWGADIDFSSDNCDSTDCVATQTPDTHITFATSYLVSPTTEDNRWYGVMRTTTFTGVDCE